MRSQLQTLLAEKAALAQENARLLRENTGLQVHSCPGKSELEDPMVDPGESGPWSIWSLYY